ncbi:MAG: PH domain-containing protein [Streptosporangiales bacterium]|nr:PH domain-containing protein [Streptosporangiales bacterium]
MPDEDTECRASPEETRNWLIGTVVLLAVDALLGVITFLAVPRLWGLESVAVLVFPVVLYGYLDSRLSWTRFGPEGIRGRNPFGRFEYRWDEISNVTRREHRPSRRPTYYTIALTTTSGGYVAVPVLTSRAPEFNAAYTRIRGAWQHATGRTGPESVTRPAWPPWRLLLPAAVLVQVFAVMALMVFLAYGGPKFELIIPVIAIPALLAAEIAVPVYRASLRRRRDLARAWRRRNAGLVSTPPDSPPYTRASGPAAACIRQSGQEGLDGGGVGHRSAVDGDDAAVRDRVGDRDGCQVIAERGAAQARDERGSQPRAHQCQVTVVLQ